MPAASKRTKLRKHVTVSGARDVSVTVEEGDYFIALNLGPTPPTLHNSTVLWAEEARAVRRALKHAIRIAEANQNR